MHDPLMFVLSLKGGANHYQPLLEAEKPEAILALAQALAASPVWAKMPEALLVVHPGPEPKVGIMGYFDVAAEARIKALQSQLDITLARLRYVSYQQAETDCEHLAAKLIKRFGHQELRQFHFIAIPRGGLIVLGMLAYALGLNAAQLEPPSSKDAPLVVVDDCAISGSRFGRFLAEHQNRPLVFAHLYSHPDLRTAIKNREPQVIDCLSAQDLYDHAPESLGDEYAAWKVRWTDRSDQYCYWAGQPDHVCFPWNEPDVCVWNPTTEQVEPGWRILPPHLCLKNRPAPGTEAIPVQVQPQGKGPLQPSANVLFGEFEGQTIIGNIETGSSFCLSGVAADMWHSLVEQGNSETALKGLLQAYDIDEATLAADLDKFVTDLLAQGLLEKNNAPHPHVSASNQF